MKSLFVMRYNDEVTISLETDNVRVANHYRHALSFIPCYAITYVEFYQHNMPLLPEVICSMRFGQIPVNNEKLEQLGAAEEYRFDFRAEGKNGPFRTSDIIGLPVLEDFVILSLQADQFLEGQVILKKGDQSQHARWAVASSPVIFQTEDGTYNLTYRYLGVWDPETILKEMPAALDKARNQPTFADYWNISGPSLR